MGVGGGIPRKIRRPKKELLGNHNIVIEAYCECHGRKNSSL
jgi:hypothetical protein